MTERWDLYNGAGEKTDVTIFRGMPIPKGYYHLSVSAWIRNSKGQYLLSQRHPKKQYPLLWECTGGSVLAGEDSLCGALREVKEELGITLDPAGAEQLCHTRRDSVQDFYDVWQFHADIELSEIQMQENEVVDVKWVYRDELLDMYEKGGLLHPLLTVKWQK